ncbi:MAG: hypothetical protein H9Q66_00490, partial [Spiroplasma ixodetis]|nr:hypothetical protein [Spiroplasma ixodetis]
QHKNQQHFKLLNSYQISRTSVYQKIVLKSVAIPLVSESGISEWSDSFGESINIDMNINFHSPKQTVVA